MIIDLKPEELIAIKHCLLGDIDKLQQSAFHAKRCGNEGMYKLFTEAITENRKIIDKINVLLEN